MGYPLVPLYLRLADCFSYWMISGHCPVLELPVMFMLNEETSLDQRKKRLEAVGEKLIHTTWKSLSKDEQSSRLMESMKLLNFRGVLDLLGMRCTVGSCLCLPPSRTTLLASFNRKHSPIAKLSVGGRALTKHCHRDNSHQWWGKCTGSEETKNEHALRIALEILNTAVWINAHILPHDVQVIEVRNEKGYGMRWLCDGSEFRGFLEPQMEDGHSVNWRH